MSRRGRDEVLNRLDDPHFAQLAAEYMYGGAYGGASVKAIAGRQMMTQSWHAGLNARPSAAAKEAQHLRARRSRGDR